jgi:hypothetical protein
MTSDEREALARAQTMGWAQEAADRGELEEALDWLHVAEQLHGQLSAEWEQTRKVWMRLQTPTGRRSDLRAVPDLHRPPPQA